MFKKIGIVVLTILILSSCRSKKTKGEKANAKLLNKVINQYNEKRFDKKTVKASLKIKYKGKQKLPIVNASLRIEKDKVIWLSVSKIISIGRLKITPNSVQFYNKLDHSYYDGDFTLLSIFLGTEVDFKQVQNIFLGEAVYNLDKKNYDIIAEGENFIFKPKEQNPLFDLLFWLNANNYKINKQEIRKDNKLLAIQYDGFETVNDVLFPKHINILAKEVNNTNVVDINYKNVVFDMDLSFPFKIPDNYKEMKL